MTDQMSLDWMSERDFMRLIKIVAQVWGKDAGPIIDGLVRIREHR